MKRKYTYLLGVAVLILLVSAFWLFGRGEKGDSVALIATPTAGEFLILIETSGELEAKNSVEIKGPTSLRNFGIWNINIQQIIEEGTVVKKGDWVATLDRSELQNRYNTKQLELEKANSRYIQTQLDTTLQMRQSRDELVNLKYAVEEREIILAQSKFEPPATIKQAEINLDKAKRAFEQAEENYKIKQKQYVEKMREVGAEVRKVRDELTNMEGILSNFSVTAPEDGMVIYRKGYDGKPIKAGSQINMWDPVVATLPDLSTMLSVTFVNEVDVRRVEKGQEVKVGLDAYPDKTIKGVVTKVANVGEQRNNSDSKVFQVNIELQGYDPALRPAMTTSNKIIARRIDSVLHVPLECLHSQDDSITYVYVKDGLSIVKQEVETGDRNASSVIIKNGITLNAKVYLSIPSGHEDKEVRLLPDLDGKRRKVGEQDSLAQETTLPALPAYRQ
jgi:multidrug efflux pump subunit AcrA (membrane-fusion protein)